MTAQDNPLAGVQDPVPTHRDEAVAAGGLQPLADRDRFRSRGPGADADPVVDPLLAEIGLLDDGPYVPEN